MPSSPVRVRLAPSPTGYFHVGGARTALYNWLYARQEGGEFLLRIEDTDTERNREEWVEALQHSMRWLGLDWDHRAYRSTEFLHLHDQTAKRLLESGHAYYCDCTGPVLQARKADRGEKTPGYDGHCRDRDLGPGAGHAIRFRTADDGTTSFSDVVRGDVSFDNRTIEDFVIVRSNGAAIFVLANLVEDIELGVTHVIRSEEHLSNVPKALMLCAALDVAPPEVWAHLPLLVNEKRQKISKRRPEDKVAIEEYRDEGFLPEAMRNYLALLGWGPKDDQELMSTDELLAKFRLEDVNNSPAFFDQQKLRHFNNEYVKALPTATFVSRSLPWLESEDAPYPPEAFDLEVFNAIAPLVQERVHVLSDVAAMVDFLFLDDVVIDDASWAKATKGGTAGDILAGALDAFGGCEWTRDAIEAAALQEAERCALRVGKWQAPVRVAVTGRAVGPPLWESLHLLGRERVATRLRRAQARLE